MTVELMNKLWLKPVFTSDALVVALAGCQSLSEPQRLIIPTALTCPDCPTVAVTGTIDCDT